MITKLRRKFILITMCSTIAVLGVIIGTLNLVSYGNMVQRADNILELLAENDAAFPILQPDNWKQQETAFFPNKENRMLPPKPGHIPDMSPETPYETRFFSVKLNDDGNVIWVDTGKIAAIETKDAVAFAQDIWKAGRVSGFYDSYRYKVVWEQEDCLILFVDRSREISSLKTLFTASISVSLIGVAAILVLVIIFSKIVFKPVAASYEKQKRFITDASHELKTPLTIISANVEVLEMDSEENTWTKSIKNQISRLTLLVEQMVTLSRMDEENSLQITEEFSLSHALRETIEAFHPLADREGKVLELTIEGEYSYHGDEKRIRQMLSLLMDNAVKYASGQGSIKVYFGQKGRHYQIVVWNTVDEIQKGNLDILFERFYRLDASRNSQTGGSGIGLSIVKSIVEAHKGKISARSEDGKSLQISVIL